LSKEVKLKKLHIENYKSLVDLEIVEPNPFTVFAGPNGSGKSNIFEALEFMSYCLKLSTKDVEQIFGGQEAFLNYRHVEKVYLTRKYLINYDFKDFSSFIKYSLGHDKRFTNGIDILDGFYSRRFLEDSEERPSDKGKEDSGNEDMILTQRKFLKNFLRLFIGDEKLNRIKYTSDKKLLPDASNLEAIIKDILSNGEKEEFIEWIELFVPGFENIEIHSDNISGRDSLLIYEKGTKKPFTKNLISDGTYNILCVLAAIYQSKEPQFLCIEEPENGLNPYVVRSLVEFFRKQCEEKGHYIWLNTHSATLVKELRPEELILVDKIDGATKVKQFSKDHNIYSLDMDEAWLSNALGGGIPW
jgi:predicted ATPase